MSSLQSRCEAEVTELLKKSGVRVSTLSEIPLRQIRHAQRGAFPDMRMAHLAANLRDQFLKQPILKDLLCTRVGFQGPSPAHYIPRPAGSYDAIFIYCTSGRGWLEIGGREWTINPRDAFFIPAHLPHKYGADPDDPWANYWVHLQGRQTAAYADLITSGKKEPVIHLHRHEEMIACIEQLFQYMSNVHTTPALIAASGALSQLLSLIQLRMNTAEPKSRTSEENLERTIDFMHKNLGKRLTLAQLAKIASISPNHYGALFSKRYNHAPMEYFQRLKIQKACELLSTTNRQISEIGETLGFSDPYYFSRAFKKVMGIPPRDYR